MTYVHEHEATEREAGWSSVVSKKARRRALARQKWERQQARRAERRRRARRRAIISGAVLAVLAVIAGSTGIWWLARDDDSASASPQTTSPPSPTTSASPTASPTPGSEATCDYEKTSGDDELSLGLPKATFTTPASATATITTDQGRLEVELFADKAPCAVQSLRFLADKDAYDRTPCTELAVAPSRARYLGCGGLSKAGDKGPGYRFGHENTATEVEPGTLVMAGPENGSGSRFLITYGKKATFEQPVTVLGKVTSGLPVVTKVADGGLAETKDGAKGDRDGTGVGSPKTKLVIEDIKVTTT